MYPNIVLAGGPGVGKSSFAKLLQQKVPEYVYLYMSLPANRIPITLTATTYPDLLSKQKEEYIQIIKENRDIALLSYPREELNAFAQRAMTQYGKELMGELAFAFCDNKPTIIDGIAGVPSARFLQKKEFLIIGFSCSFAIQVERRRKALRDIDAQKNIEESVRTTNAFLDVAGCLKIANVVYDTEKMSTEEIVEDLLVHLNTRTETL